MSLPTVRATGTPAFIGTGSTTVTLPTHESSDILVLAVEAQQNDTIATPSGGWAHFPDSPQSLISGTTPNSINLAVFWLRASSSSETNPTISIGASRHIGGVAIAVQGCVTAGNPYDVTSPGTATTSSVVVPGDTTTQDDCLIIVVVATTRDANSTANFSSWANADLGSVGEIVDQTSNADSGGGLGVATGTKAAAGAFGATTVTAATSDDKAYIAIALKGIIAGAATHPTGSGNMTPGLRMGFNQPPNLARR